MESMEEATEDIFRSEILFKLNATTSRRAGGRFGTRHHPSGNRLALSMNDVFKPCLREISDTLPHISG